MRAKAIVAVTVAALAATILLLGGALRESQGAAGVRAALITRPFGVAAGTTVEVRRLQAEVRERPDDAGALARLGLAYEQRARETANPAYLTKADGVLRRALALAPQSAEATVGLGSLALSRHQFGRALTLGRRAQSLAPGTGITYGIVGDALVELGRYDAAFRAFDAMAREKPGGPAYARVAYGRELLGDRAGAAQALRLAAEASEGRPEPAAWAHVELGKLYFGSGRATAAAREYGVALRRLPGYVYALDALAHVEAARGRHARATALARQALDAVPLPQFATTLGDVLWVAGRRAEAREQWALVGAVERLLRANGVRADLEIAQFYADHGLRLRHALVLARRAHVQRPSIEGDDVVAWTLIRNGQCAEGLRWSKRALRLGTRDATKFFHRGMAERCLGHGDEARRWFRRALALNPHFSLLWSPVARRLS